MASRRARLKAVANLPVRRKPSSQDSVESGENENTEDNHTFSQDKVKVNEVEDKTNKKENSKNEVGSGNVAEAIKLTDTHSELEKLVNTPNESDNANSTEKEVTKEKKEEIKPNISAGPARFGRRVKPTVCLPVRKERAQNSDSEKAATNKVEVVNEEINKVVTTPTADQVDVNNKTESSNVLEIKKVPEPITQSTLNQQNVLPLNQKLENDKASKSAIASVNKEIALPEKSDKILTNVAQSPSKTQRPVFLRPNIDLSFRRTDDYKNVALSPRIRNISESSNSGSVVVQNITSQTDSSAMDSRRNLASILKRKRSKANDLTRKMADARREFHRRYEKIKPDRSSLRMIDLIFYNPATNPMVSKAKLEKKESASDEDELLNEGKVDEPDTLDNSEKEDYDDDDDPGKMPVPQVKIGLNGEIILDEKSLVIETTDAKRGREDLQNSVPVFEDRSSKMSYYCRKSKKSKDWSDSETKRFYKALNTLGTDFLLMKEIFPNRSRLELKNKFKREEKLNRNLIDKALRNPSEFDMTELEKDLADEQRIEEEENELKQQKKTKPRPMEPRIRTKSSFLSREMVESDNEMSNGDDVNQSPKPIVNSEKEKAKKMKDIDMLYEKFITKGNLNDNEPKTSKKSQITDTNENISKCNNNNVNISESYPASRNYKGHRRKSKNIEIDESATINNVESTNNSTDIIENQVNNETAIDLSIRKEITDNNKPVKNLKSGKRKPEPAIGRRRSKRRKREPLIYSPDREEEPEPVSEETEKDLVVTKTITDDDFLQLLAANVKCMKESKIKVQVSNTSDKEIEVIFDEVPPITAKEIEDQNVTVLADCNTTICEESPASPDDCEKLEECNSKETSVIVENPNALKTHKLENLKEDNVVENENVMVVIDENDQGLTTEYQYMLVEEQEVETVPTDDIAQNVEIEDDVNVEEEEKNEKVMTTIQNPTPINTPSIVVCKAPQSEAEKMYLAGLSAGSFVLMASDSPNEQKEKRFSMFMISEKSQSDGSSVLSSMPVILPPELVSSLTQEMGCS